jgi:hypothetical protein
MDWHAFQNAISGWAQTATGLMAVWLHEARPITDKPFVTLQVISVVQPEPDAIIRQDPGQDTDLATAVCMRRHVTVSCQVKTRTQHPSEYALLYAEKLRASLRRLDVMGELEVNGVVPLRAETIQVTAQEWANRMESRATLDVVFSASFAEMAPPTGWFDTVELSSDLKGTDGELLPSSMQLDDEEISANVP